MKIELKNIRTHQGRQGYGLNADILVDGKKVVHVLDSGNGGCFDYTLCGQSTDAYLANGKVLKQLEEYAKTIMINETFEHLDALVNKLVLETEYERTNLKFIAKKQKSAILVGNPANLKSGKFECGIFSYGKVQLSLFPKQQLQGMVDKAKLKLKPKQVILNTNLKELGIIF